MGCTRVKGHKKIKMSINYLGQSILCGISGTSLLEDERKFLQEENIGGVILFAQNYEDPAQLSELINEIQACRDEYPLFISVDNEGGRVFRFKKQFTNFPAMGALAKLDSPKLIFEVHAVFAKELSACGVNLNFAPVCDVLRKNTTAAIGDRAFSEDPVMVEKCISGAIRGLQTNGVLGCAKHFPGHGNTSKDSHFDLPYISQSMEEFQKIDFIPFKKASRSRVEFIMMAHLVCDAIDPNLPCTLSTKAYELLRSELKYKGIIITDDMYMDAVRKKWGIEKASLMAYQAGADILCHRHLEDAQKALEELKNNYKTKKISKERVEDSFDRIINIKKAYLSDYKPVYIPEITEKFQSASGKELLHSIQEKLAK